MRAPPSRDHDVLPRSTIQRFGMLIVAIVLVAALFSTGDRTLLAAVLSAGMAFVFVGGVYERARHEMEKVVRPDPPDDPPATS